MQITKKNASPSVVFENNKQVLNGLIGWNAYKHVAPYFNLVYRTRKILVAIVKTKPRYPFLTRDGDAYVEFNMGDPVFLGPNGFNINNMIIELTSIEDRPDYVIFKADQDKTNLVPFGIGEFGDQVSFSFHGSAPKIMARNRAIEIASEINGAVELLYDKLLLRGYNEYAIERDKFIRYLTRDGEKISHNMLPLALDKSEEADKPLRFILASLILTHVIGI